MRVLDEHTIAFPGYDGNGMYLSPGNVAQPTVGMLFIDFERHRLRFNGVATIDARRPAARRVPRCTVLVRVRTTQVLSELPALHPQPAAGRALALHAARRLRAAGAGLEAPRSAGSRRALRLAIRRYDTK